MAKSIFDKMENIHEVNRMAVELRRLGMREKLKELADKNRVMDEDFEAFFLGKRYFLVDAGETQKTYDTARAKLMDEMLILNDPLFGNVIGGYLLQCCSEPGFQESVLQEHKTLQRCIEYVMEMAYGLLDENQKKARRNGISIIWIAQTTCFGVFWTRRGAFLDQSGCMIWMASSLL